MVAGVLLVSSSLKLVMLHRYVGFRADLMMRPVSVMLRLLVASCVEHAIFTATVFWFLSESFSHIYHKDNIEGNVRLYHALAFPELGKVFVSFLQVWDAEQTMPLIFGLLMLSIQYMSLKCVAPVGTEWKVLRAFAVAVTLKTLCRLCFHSIYYTLALGVIL